MAEHAHITPTLARRRLRRAAPGASDRRYVPAIAQTACTQVTLLAEAKIGSELKAAQDRNELARPNEPVRQYAPASGILKATLPGIGIPRQRAAEYKKLAAPCLADVGGLPWWSSHDEACHPDPRLARLLRGTVTPAQRARIERDIELLIALLDALGGDTDLEEEHEGCCDAHDDDPASTGRAWSGNGGPGDPADAEPSDCLEPGGGWLAPAAGWGTHLLARRP